MTQIKENLEKVEKRMAQAATKAGRKPGDITLVAVTKTYPADVVKQGVEAGIAIIGENRVQEAAQKYSEIGAPPEWHLIGHLQSNKAKKAVEIFSLIHSIDSVVLVREVGRRAEEAGKIQDVLLEVNTSGEPQKYGFQIEEAVKILTGIKDIRGVKVLGLMTVGPLTEDVEKVRESFRKLRTIYDEIAGMGIPNVEMRYLSMGMSGDFEIAIEEGSNMVRIGSAIFGARS
jgi:pyridoxal phosphate enzyme (YggS family)